MSQQEEQHSPSRGVAVEVQDFYERYPYPRPIDSLEKYRRFGQDRQSRRVDYHLFWPARPYREDLSILIAGCGTSQAAKHALRWPAAQVTGIDFSATSVRSTEELKRKYNLDNLQVRQLPIERVSDLETSFDQIICTGVLHHLADPDAGLSALRGVLKPDGAMHLMVYAPYGRAGIYMLQEFCRRIGIHANDEGDPRSHRCAHSVATRPSVGKSAARGPGFPPGGGARRRAAEPAGPQLFSAAIIRFHRKGRTDIRPVVKTSTLHPSLRNRSKDSAGFPAERPFRSRAVCRRRTISRHNGTPQRGCLPRRQPWRPRNRSVSPVTPGSAMCRFECQTRSVLQERLPPGAAGVLINQTHAYRDLIMPIDSTEKRLFDAIDGSCSIGGIVERTLPSAQTKSQLDMARTFFEKLWWYDQVVFDASRCRARREET